MERVLPQIMPYPRDYADGDLTVTVAGKHFGGYQAGDTFTCMFFGAWFQVNSTATVVSDTELNCPAPKEIFCKRLPCFI